MAMNKILEFKSHRRSIYVQVRTTSLGVLMSVSLALLAYNVFQDPKANTDGAEAARAIGSFTVIIWVTMEYISYSMIQDRYPNWGDTIQLYMLGGAQIACSGYVDNLTAWFISSVSMALLGIWAYISQWPTEQGEYFFSKILEPVVIKNLRIAFACCAGSLVTLGVYHYKVMSNIPIIYVLNVEFSLRDIVLVLPYLGICGILWWRANYVKRKIMVLTARAK